VTAALRVTQPSDAFRTLFAALEEHGERAGWLELGASAAAAAPVEASLEAGAWKVVAVSADSSVAVKRRRGPAVLRDLLREHFRGCRVVLVRGDADLPTLRWCGAEWELVGGDGECRRLDTAGLVRALRSPTAIR
jgi:hypothetical protein